MCKESTQGATTGSVAELLLDKDKNIYPSPRAPYVLLIWLRTQVNKRSCPWQRRCQCLLLWNRKLDAFVKQRASGFSGCETLSSPVSQTYSDPILLVQQDAGTISISELSNLSLLFFDYIVKLNLKWGDYECKLWVLLWLSSVPLADANCLQGFFCELSCRK